MTTHRIPASVDTRQAKSGVRDLDRSKKSAIERASEKARSAAARKVRSVAGALGGFSAVHRISRVRAGEVDPWSEALTPLQAAFGQFVDETLGYSASARKQAREKVKSDYARVFAERGDAAALRGAYDIELSLRTEESAGLKILRQDKQFVGPSLTELIMEAIPGYFRLVGKSVEYMVQAFFR